ncbi:MAG TPA: hypothetical protein VFE62_20955 [Gemmataceae bacterium]|nr:hypothetical protein [Gemmataceae bacterium]
MSTKRARSRRKSTRRKSPGALSHLACSELAKAILQWDKRYPGDIDASMEVSADQWAQMVKLAQSIA